MLIFKNSRYCVFVLAAITLTGSFTIANGLAGMNPITPAIERAYGNIYKVRNVNELVRTPT